MRVLAWAKEKITFGDNCCLEVGGYNASISDLDPFDLDGYLRMVDREWKRDFGQKIRHTCFEVIEIGFPDPGEGQQTHDCVREIDLW